MDQYEIARIVMLACLAFAGAGGVMFLWQNRRF